MKRGRPVGLVLLGCALVLLVALTCLLLWPGEREPSYQGKTVREWSRLYVKHQAGGPQPNVDDAERSIESVRQMREEVLPYALRSISYDKPAWMNGAQKLIERCRVQRVCPPFVLRELYRNRQLEGVLYFQILGTNGAPAILELEKIAMDRKRPNQAMFAEQALAGIGEPALLSLMRIAAFRQAPLRYEAISWLTSLGSNAAPALPVFLGRLNDPDTSLACNAAEILGRLKLDPEQCVPALTNQFHCKDATVREAALRAVGHYGQDARSAVPSLIEAYWDLNPRIHNAARDALARIAPEELTNGFAR